MFFSKNKRGIVVAWRTVIVIVLIMGVFAAAAIIVTKMLTNIFQ